MQASLVKLYRAWPRLDTGADPDAGPGRIDAYLRRIMVNTQWSWWRARWRRETPAAVLPEAIGSDGIADRQALGALVRQALAGLPRQQRTVLEQLNPQDRLALLQDSSQVSEQGPASGPDWTGTGTAYTFTASLTTSGPFQLRLSSTGAVDVDQQGRVRRLDATETAGRTVRKTRMTFGDFGLAVSVSPPPASETFTPPAASLGPRPALSPGPAGSG